jgi:hypothetical protein
VVVFENNFIEAWSPCTISSSSTIPRARPLAPSASLNFSYGNQFKLRGEAFDWLVIGPWTAQIHGTATIRGMSGSFTFWVSVQDDELIQAPDKF